jgi:hypothetical protein
LRYSWDNVSQLGGYFSVTLPLLVARVLADDANHAAAADDFALVADLLDAGSDLHGGFSLLLYLCR